MNDFDDLLDANRRYAERFDLAGVPGVAGAGVAMITCMDARIDPLRIIGLAPGDAKVLRNPGGRVTDEVLVALVLAVNLLKAERIMIVEHTRCAMASSTQDELHERLEAGTGADATWMSLGVIDDQERTIRSDVAKVSAHPLIGDRATVGGFLYDVDTGLLRPVS